MHFPPNWEEDNLPGLTRLKKTGLTFTNAHTAACVCSPARATFLTGYFPAQHQVRSTFTVFGVHEKYTSKLDPWVGRAYHKSA